MIENGDSCEDNCCFHQPSPVGVRVCVCVQAIQLCSLLFFYFFFCGKCCSGKIIPRFVITGRVKAAVERLETAVLCLCNTTLINWLPERWKSFCLILNWRLEALVWLIQVRWFILGDCRGGCYRTASIKNGWKIIFFPFCFWEKLLTFQTPLAAPVSTAEVYWGKRGLTHSLLWFD